MLFLRRAHSPFIKNIFKKKYIYKKHTHTHTQKQQRCEHIIRKNKQIKTIVHDENKKNKNEINKTKPEDRKHLHKSMKKEALFKQTALAKAAISIK